MLNENPGMIGRQHQVDGRRAEGKHGQARRRARLFCVRREHGRRTLPAQTGQVCAYCFPFSGTPCCDHRFLLARLLMLE